MNAMQKIFAANGPAEAPPADWATAEQAVAKAEADLDALAVPYTDEAVDQLADIREDAIGVIMDLPTTTAAQALRKIELAMFDGTSVRTGIDFPALLADAKRLADVATARPSRGHRFDAAHAEFQRLRTIEHALPGYGVEEEDTHLKELHAASDATDTAFAAMITIPVRDGPRAAAKLQAIADQYDMAAGGVREEHFAQVHDEIDAILRPAPSSHARWLAERYRLFAYANERGLDPDESMSATGRLQDVERIIFDTPAPDLHAMAIKLLVLVELIAEDGEKVAKALVEEARAFGIGAGVGISEVRTPDPMVAAWDCQRRDPDELSEKVRPAARLLAREDATSIKGVIAKLRSSLWTGSKGGVPNIDAVATSDLPISMFDHVFETELAGRDYPVECLWTAIRSLENMVSPA